MESLANSGDGALNTDRLNDALDPSTPTPPPAKREGAIQGQLLEVLAYYIIPPLKSP